MASRIRRRSDSGRWPNSTMLPTSWPGIYGIAIVGGRLQSVPNSTWVPGLSAFMALDRRCRPMASPDGMPRIALTTLCTLGREIGDVATQCFEGPERLRGVAMPPQGLHVLLGNDLTHSKIGETLRKFFVFFHPQIDDRFSYLLHTVFGRDATRLGTVLLKEIVQDRIGLLLGCLCDTE